MNAVIYARYSSDNQREESIEGQLRECREYAERNGMNVVSTYIDRALSAKTDDRPQFQQMIRDSNARQNLRPYWCGSWTVSPATATIRQTTKENWRRTMSVLFPQQSRFQTRRRESCWKACWRG